MVSRTISRALDSPPGPSPKAASKFRRLKQALAGLGLLTGTVVLPAWLESSGVTSLHGQEAMPVESVRARMLRLLGEIHSQDPLIASRAETELREIGAPEDQLRYARLLKHPDRVQRFILINTLHRVPDPLKSDLQFELTRDPDEKVRAAVVPTITPSSVDSRMLQRLYEMQASEDDERLRRRVAEIIKHVPPAIAAQVSPHAIRPGGVSQSLSAPVESIPGSRLPHRDRTAASQAGPAIRQMQVLPAEPVPVPVFDDDTTTSDSERTTTESGPVTPGSYLRAPKAILKFPESKAGATRGSRAPSLPAPDFDDDQPAFDDDRPDFDSGRIEQTGLQAGPVARAVEFAAFDAASTPAADNQLPAPPSPDIPPPQAVTPEEVFGAESSPLTNSLRSGRQPEILNRPIDSNIAPSPEMAMAGDPDVLLLPELFAPRGFTGPSGIAPPEYQQDSHFVPQVDRWRNGYPRQDRYGLGYPWTMDYIGVEGHWWDPYNQNVLKGDYPIIGQHTFMNIQATSQTLIDYAQVPVPTSPFESTRSSNQEEFFGQPNNLFFNQNFFLRFDLFHGNQAAFKPLDWQLRVVPAVNINQLHVQEQGLIDPNVLDGRTRPRDHFVIQEYFAEVKLADLSPDYDFVSARAGSQLFNSDFRGFIFFDTNRGVRLFGSRFSNRHQFNLAYFDMQEKETNSGLNTLKDRHQDVLIANYYIQDFVFPGYTFQTSMHYNHDQPSRLFDRNKFLVRPDPVGVFQPHRVESLYLGFAGDGHIGRINVNNAFYWVTGRDSLNPIGGQAIDINAFMGALELSYDRDWARFRTSVFYASGDDDPNDNKGEGFDTIMDNPIFAGGEFSYWQRQAIQLFGVRLVNDRSLTPDLRSSRIQGQSNFTNPGLLLFNVGFDADVTPKLRMITNANYLMFDKTEVLQTYTFQGDVDKEIGVDLSMGFEWRPFHNDNAIILAGVSTLIPDEGFKDLYNQFNSGDTDQMYASFFEMILNY